MLGSSRCGPLINVRGPLEIVFQEHGNFIGLCAINQASRPFFLWLMCLLPGLRADDEPIDYGQIRIDRPE